MSAHHAAIVLAAGGSERLGHPKQLLQREGEMLVHRATRLALETQPSRVVLVTGAQADAMEKAVADLEAAIIANPQWRSGLSGSLAAAASALHEHAGPVLVIGCDQPALQAHHLDALLAGAMQAASRCAATVHDGRLGIPAVITSALLQEASMLTGDRGFGQHLNAMPAGSVWQLHAPELQFDIDTPENEQAAIARGLLDASDPAA